jgi:uncharacterized membrane protein
MKTFLKTTIVGGALFLLPVALVLLALNHVLHLVIKVIRPVLQHLDVDHDVAGFAVATLLAVLLLVIIAFAAGIVARTGIGRRISAWFETSLLGNVPQYQLMKSMGEGLAQIEGADDLKPVLVSAEAGWQIGYLLEVLDNGWVAVFVPQAPTPAAGDIRYLPADHIRPLNISMIKARAIVKHIGIGSGDALRGIDLARRT